MHILYCIALVVADFEAMDLRTFAETVQLQSLRLRLSQALLLPFHQVDMARDELFIDGVLEILAANDITEIRHFKGVDKLKYRHHWWEKGKCVGLCCVPNALHVHFLPGLRQGASLQVCR